MRNTIIIELSRGFADVIVLPARCEVMILDRDAGNRIYCFRRNRHSQIVLTDADEPAIDDNHAAAIALALKAVWVPGHWAANCPAHDDRNRALAIIPGTSSRNDVTLLCQAGCSIGAIDSALTSKDL